eukprot:TRINITY_DN18075_c0_g1_i1.p1 TRINITY_DN18075_c0_g1~~TRINITY_DN18075_c0_g1_i1.p1  ORF type:complete len:341 (-),score=80.43 TRINITY_DN18075_c0_g1_i1:24-974(-)
MEKINELKAQLSSALLQKNATETLRVLAELEAQPMPLEILQTTKIGCIVGKMRKTEDPPEVAEAATRLVVKWKTALRVASPPASRTPPARSPRQAGAEGIVRSASANSAPSNPRKQRHEDSDEGDSPKPKRRKESVTPSHSSPQRASSPYGKSTDTRGRCRSLLAQVLGPKGANDKCDPTDLAEQIEAELYKACSNVTDKQYTSKFRTIHFNVHHPKSTELRDALMAGEITPERLCSMDVRDMAPEEMKEQRKKVQEDMIKNLQPMRPEDLATSDQYECRRCHKRMTTIYQLQTRSADEPMTTYVTCVACNNRWKF